MNDLTSYLFAQPSFLSGVARLVDMGGQYDQYNTADTPDEADSRAIAADWRVVGDDMRTAYALLGKEGEGLLRTSGEQGAVINK